MAICFSIVGFISHQNITFEENIGAVNLTVGLISGKLCGELAIEVSFSNDSLDATGNILEVS